MNFIKKLLDSEYKELCRFEKLAEEIEKLEASLKEHPEERKAQKALAKEIITFLHGKDEYEKVFVKDGDNVVILHLVSGG